MSREMNPSYEPGMGERIGNSVEDTQSFTNRMKDRATQIGNTVSETMDRGRENAAKGLDRAASSIHDGAGSAAKMAHGFADGMENTASYLRSHTWGDMGSDIGDLCRRHPVQALVSAAVVGFLLGRVIRR